MPYLLLNMDNCITTRKYSKKDGWLDVFPDCIVKLSKLDLTYDWEEIFKELFENKKKVGFCIQARKK